MAAGPLTQVSDIVVPEIFTPYIQQQTEEKSRLIQSGAIITSALLDEKLAGGGITFNVPSFKDLDNDADNVSTDDPADIIALSVSAGSPALPGSFNDSLPLKTGTATEVAVRLNRNNSWSSAALAGALAGADPLQSISDRVSAYWRRRMQAIFLATMNGVCKDNGVNDGGDYANEIVGGSFVDGVTNFSAEAVIDTALTMGDSMEGLTMIMMHSVVYARAQKNNLIDFIPDARGEISIPTFLGREVIVDDGVPSAAGVVRADGSTAGVAGMYETWLFGAGALVIGSSAPDVPTEVVRQAAAGNGGGQEILHSRQQWSLHPVGHAYTGTPADGGPANGVGANDLNNAGSWNRVYSERKQIPFARLISREA